MIVGELFEQNEVVRVTHSTRACYSNQLINDRKIVSQLEKKTKYFFIKFPTENSCNETMNHCRWMKQIVISKIHLILCHVYL